MCDLFGVLLVEIYKDLKSLLSHPAFTLDRHEFHERHRNLMDQLGKLEARRQDIETALRRGDRTKECEKWIETARRIEDEVRLLKDKYEQEEMRSCKFVYCCTRYKLGEDMVKKTGKAEEIFRAGGDWIAGISSAGEPRKRMSRRRIRPLDSEWMRSVHKDAEEKLISFLRDEEVGRIGVWGITGSGKSMIMDYLRKNDDVVSLFETVISVTVSEDWGVKELQDDIMEQLKVIADGSGGAEMAEKGAEMAEKARRISEALQGKRCLILIDNFEEKVELDQILGIQDKQKRSRSKVVFASRSRGVCLSTKADDLVHVDRLSPDDAWIMFKELVGDVIGRFPRIEEEARLVVKECDGLPLLIDMVARNLRNITDHIYWVIQKKQLRGWETLLQGMDEALQTLEFCYDSLDDPSKKCFLYCALYPEERKIYVDHLLECWIAEGFIQDKRFRDARDMGHSILHDLISGSFLARTESSKYVKMSKLLRKMALKISSQNTDFRLSVHPPDIKSQHSNQINQEWHKPLRISLMDSHLRELPVTAPDCSKLLTLFLQRNKNLVDIPKNFFRSMHSLRVLDLYGTGIASLPPSLSKLVSLIALYLNSCSNLVEIPSGIKRLMHLEVLDIRKTKLNLHQIRSLTRLRCLRISFSSLINMANQRRGRVSDFCSLEEFSVFTDSSQKWTNINVEEAIQEVANLDNLTSLQFCFPNLNYLKLFVSKRPIWKNSNNTTSHFTFHFNVGLQDSARSPLLDSVDYPIRNSLNLVDTEGSDQVFRADRAFAEVLKETDVFGLIKQKNVSSLSSFGMGNMEKMLVCLIEDCDDIEVIVCSRERKEAAVLKFLKDLFIKNLKNLRSIWEGHVPDGSLAQLTTLVFSNCPKLKFLLSDGLIQQLNDLKHLKVEECHQIEEIIVGSECEEFRKNDLPSLKSIELVHLPQLRSILGYSFEYGSWPSLQKIKISMCDMLKRLPFSDGCAAKLRRIEGQQSWWDALEWEDQAYKERLQSHFHTQLPSSTV